MRRYAAIVCMLLLQLTGCTATELEDRCFPMMAAVDYQDGQVEFAYGFPELSQKDNTDVEAAKMDAPMAYGVNFENAVARFHQELDKKADCNHMKVLVLSAELMGQEEVLGDMTDYLRESELFPRNIYVCVSADMQELFETEELLSTDLGSYLETFLLNHEDDKGVELTNLGTVMDESLNHSKALQLPYLVVDNGSIIWDGFYEL